MSNRLAHSTSPYLRQHAENPVDWYPWGPEALARARTEDRPILLSIGYAACHWCHVMAHESFEHPATAALMNDLFVNIKVDREERPDIDSIYMQAVQAMTGQGGWPMTVFLTPEGEPFFGGTYFPPDDRHGMPSFTRLLRSVNEAWRTKRDSVRTTTTALRKIYDVAQAPAGAPDALTPVTLDRAFRGTAQSFDARNGGFGGAPKFPPTMSLDFMLRYWRRHANDGALDMVLRTWHAMARGGLHDQVGGGFHRYTVDAIWLVPHFEKMLYDNALLVRLGAHLWQATRDAEVRAATERTIDWLAREMTSPEGGFYSSLDADSEGHEGVFYVWSHDEFARVLGADAELLAGYWGVTLAGNFEGRTILHVRQPPVHAAARLGVSLPELEAAVARGRVALLVARAARIRPGLDDKIVAGWNGLMLRGVCAAARAFGRPADRALALRAAEFCWRALVRDGRVWRVRPAADTTDRIVGYLEDHAALALGFIATYELTFDDAWIDRARAIAAAMQRWFWDVDAQRFFDTASDAEPLITRPRDVTDNAMPSGHSLATELLLVLAELTGDDALRVQATTVLDSMSDPLARYPSAFGHLLGAADLAVHGAVEIALSGTPGAADFDALDAAIGQHYVPSVVLAGGRTEHAGDIALLRDRPMVGDAATAYVCRRYACERPVTSPAELGARLDAAGRAAASLAGGG